MSIVLTFLQGISQNIISSYAIRKSEKILKKQRISFFPKRRYFNSLKTLINKMPFIYKDIHLKTLDHYVDVGIKRLDLKTLLDVDINKKQLGLSINDKVKAYDRAILLGNAGIGKTTFFRHTILEILAGKNVNYLGNTVGMIPIYISLKTVENIDKSPILNYIFNEIPFFSHQKGKKRFINYARERVLFLVLDGYDEIGFIGKGNTNYIRKELKFLMSYSLNEIDSYDIEEDYLEIYKFLFDNKVWLSSRKEFYHRNDLELNEHKDGNRGGEYLAAIGVLGLGNNRAKLIKKKFSIYKSKNEKFINLLDHECFLERIDKTYDNELIEFSNNPLFLTILIYLYVKQVEEKNTIDVSISSNLSEIVNKCLELLLIDLDVNKVLNINGEAKKLAFIQRKSDFKEEKREFLNFFAGRLYEEKKNVFSDKFFFEEIESFFKKQSESEHRFTISQGIESKSLSNIGYQLIFSGIFVTASYSQNEPNYDFPHRRFRELLAASYFKKHNNINNLLDIIEDESLSELIVVTYNETEHHELIFKELLSKMTSTENIYYSDVILSCIKRNKEGFNHNEIVTDAVIKSISSNKYYIGNKKILDVIRLNRTTKTLLLDNFNLNLSNGNLNSLNLICELLNKFDRTTFKRIIKKETEKKQKDYSKKYSIILRQFFIEFLSKEDNEDKILNQIDLLSRNFSSLNMIAAISSLFQDELLSYSEKYRDMLINLLNDSNDLLSLLKKGYLIKIIDSDLYTKLGFDETTGKYNDDYKMFFPLNILFFYYEKTFMKVIEDELLLKDSSRNKAEKIFYQLQKQLFPKKDINKMGYDDGDIFYAMKTIRKNYIKISNDIKDPNILIHQLKGIIKTFSPTLYRNEQVFQKEEIEDLEVFYSENNLQEITYLKKYYK